MNTIPGDSSMAMRILDLAEKGFEPTDILRILEEEQEVKAEEEPIPDNIRIIAQAFACRPAGAKDLEELFSLLSGAYASESSGEEAFLEPSSSSVSREIVLQYISDESYQFLVFEIPKGFGIEKDGMIIAACCFSTDGVSRRNGQTEGSLCSIRWLAVHESYQKLRVGRRVLSKVEEQASRCGCCRVMVCVPSSRVSVIDWLERRGYFVGAHIPYPSSLGHQLLGDEVCLWALLKQLEEHASPDFNSEGVPSSLSLPPLWRTSRKTDESAVILDAD